MSGNREGGLKAAKTNMERYGKDWYANIGAVGGKKGHTGGFANKELARRAGAMGGRKSRRAEGVQEKLDASFKDYIKQQWEAGKSIRAIAARIGVADSTIKRFLIKNGWLGEDYTNL